MTLRISLKDRCGEFCTARGHPAIPGLLSELRAAVASGQSVQIDRAGTKLITPSFIDELLVPLALDHGASEIRRLVVFVPTLEPILDEQIERGMRLRRRN